VDLGSGPSPAVRITVLLKIAGEGFEDAFATAPAWLEAPAAELEELRGVVGPLHFERLTRRAGLRPGDGWRAGGPAGTVGLTQAALDGVLGLLGLAAMPPDVLVDETPEGPRYQVPDTWFAVASAGGPDGDGSGRTPPDRFGGPSGG
jgi:hypothetical protein